MARLEKFEGARSLPGIGSPQVVPDTAVAQATESLGGQISKAAAGFGDLAELARKRQQKADDFEAEKQKHQLDTFLQQKVPEELKKARPGAIGLTEAMLIHLEKGAQRAREDVPEARKAQFDRTLSQERDRYIVEFAAVEAAESRSYYEREINGRTDRAAVTVRKNPSSFEEAVTRLNAVIDTAPVSAGVKATLRDSSEKRIIEASIEGLPLNEQISLLGSPADERSDGPGNGAGKESGSASSSVNLFKERSARLSPQSRNRLLANAIRKKSAAAREEEHRITAMIQDDPLSLEPEEIDRSGELDWSRKKRLYDMQRGKLGELEMNLEAVGWMQSEDTPDTTAKDAQAYADRAYTYLSKAENDRDAVARYMLDAKGILPANYTSDLGKGLLSHDPEKISRAFAALSTLTELDPDVLAMSGNSKTLREFLPLVSVTQARRGLPAAEISKRLAVARAPSERQGLERQLAGGTSLARLEQSDGAEILRRL